MQHDEECTSVRPEDYEAKVRVRSLRNYVIPGLLWCRLRPLSVLHSSKMVPGPGGRVIMTLWHSTVVQLYGLWPPAAFPQSPPSNHRVRTVVVSTPFRLALPIDVPPVVDCAKLVPIPRVSWPQ